MDFLDSIFVFWTHPLLNWTNKRPKDKTAMFVLDLTKVVCRSPSLPPGYLWWHCQCLELKSWTSTALPLGRPKQWSNDGFRLVGWLVFVVIGVFPMAMGFPVENCGWWVDGLMEQVFWRSGNWTSPCFFSKKESLEMKAVNVEIAIWPKCSFWELWGPYCRQEVQWRKHLDWCMSSHVKVVWSKV